MSTAEQLLKVIQELEGKPLGERYKIINNITQLAKNWNKNAVEGAEILNSFIPKDNIEKKLWVKLLSILKCEDIFLQTLTGEDNELIELLLQNGKWFFTVKKFNSDELTLKIIPNMPYSRRKSFLLCLSKYLSECEIEKYFLILRVQYGLQLALVVLPSCGITFIEEILKEEKMNVSEKLLQKIYFKHPNAAINYLKFLLENDILCMKVNNYGAIVEKLALTKPEVFLELYNKYDIRLKRLGANTTKILISVGKDLILESPKKYVNILHERQLHASLNYAEYKKFYMALFPETQQEFAVDFNIHRQVYEYLRFMKKNKFQFLSNAYKSVDGTDLMDNKDLITESFMDMLSPELRITSAQYMLENKDKHPSDWEKWYSYVTTTEAIPKLRELIYMTKDPNERLKYVEYMLKCCGINKDLHALIKVLKYLSERHRNEDIRFRQRVLKTIENKCNIKEFNMEIWCYLDECFRLINLGSEWSAARDISIKNLLIERIKYSLDNNQNIKEHIEFYIKMQNQSYSYDFNILKYNIEYEKKCINCIGEYMPELEPEYRSISTNAYNFQQTICDFNKRHPDDKMTTLKFEWVGNYINKIIKEEDKYEIPRFRELLDHDPEAKEFFASILPPHEEKATIYELHKYIKRPEIIFQQFNNIKEDALQSYNINTFLRLIRWRKFIYIPGLRDRIFEACLHEFQNSEDSTVRSCALTVLSYLMESETFYNLTKSFYPEDKKISVGRHDVGQYKIQKAIASSLARYPDSDETLYALDKFCGGDFLKLTIGSLNSVCQRINEVHSLKFLHKMLDRPVSTKKHSMRLINTIANKQGVLKMFKNLWETEKNPSMRNVIIMSVYHSFTEDPEDLTWHLLKNMFLSLNKLDKDALSDLLCNDNVKKWYMADYIEVCWTVIKKLEDVKELNLNREKSAVLNRITKYINLLQTDFLDQLVLESFLTKHVEQVQICYTNFIVTYILRGDPSQNDKRIFSVMEILKQYIKDTWSEADPDHCFIFPTRRRVFRFINELCSFSTDNKDDENIKANLLLCHKQILTIFNPTQIYKQYLNLHLTLIYLDTRSMHDFGNELKNGFIDLNVKEYGPEVISLLIDSINEFLTLVQQTSGKDVRMEVCEALMMRNHSEYCEVCAINLLVKSNSTKQLYNEITKNMKESTNKIVQIYLNEHFNTE